jgi:hypothetical protein
MVYKVFSKTRASFGKIPKKRSQTVFLYKVKLGEIGTKWAKGIKIHT